MLTQHHRRLQRKALEGSLAEELEYIPNELYSEYWSMY